ncbi:MAG: hypothetical protein JWQ27_1549 [Ferruginibacter sp.]|nr:hypothetical protein [Ferruginibacter sp.]
MRKILTTAFAFCVLVTSAQKKDSVFTSATLEHVNVYYGMGAALQHSSKASLKNGMQQVLIDGLALQADAGTIQISVPDDVTILSYYFRVFTPPAVAALPKKISRSADTIKSLQKEINLVAHDIAVYEDLLRRTTALIENNFTTPDKKNISSTELIRLTDYYGAKVKDLKDKIFHNDLKRTALQEKINDINNRLAEEEDAPEPVPLKPTGQLVMQVFASAATKSTFDISYYSRNAGWIPAYDLRMKTIDNSLKLTYKASISQTTGLDWKDAKLSLSTSNPNQGKTLPELTPAYLQLYVPAIANALNGREHTLDIDKSALQEVVITGYGAAKKQTAYSLSKVTADDISGHLTLAESQLNINFDIDLPYDIPSDGKGYSVTIKEEKIIAGFKHIAIPKMDKDAFMVAEISRWDSLNLMPGEAGVIIDNVYLGKSFIDPNSSTDTLRLSLGRDKRIAVNRVLVKDLSKTVSRGDNKVQTFTYEITVKNNKKQAISISLKDQYPLSRLKEVEISLTDAGGATIEKDKGALNWELALQPGERRQVKFTYTIKYPAASTLETGR